MKKLWGLLTLSILLMSSCKKDEPATPNDSEASPMYVPMNIGDYWIYENFQVDTLGNDSSLNKFDSVYISNDTLIDGLTYFVFKGTHYPMHQNANSILQIVRESDGDLLNTSGTKLFSSTNSNDTLDARYQISNSDTLYYWFNKMALQTVQVTVPEGTYNCLDMQQTLVMYLNQNPMSPRIFHNYYSVNKGLVSSSLFYLSSYAPWHFERKLLRSQVTVATD